MTWNLGSDQQHLDYQSNAFPNELIEGTVFILTLFNIEVILKEESKCAILKLYIYYAGFDVLNHYNKGRKKDIYVR